MNDVKQILEATIYCNIATVCDDGAPWNTPVFFGYDEQLHIYWRSWTEALHSKNLAMRPRACIAVYDASVDWGQGEGVYLQGEVTRLDDAALVESALHILDSRCPKKFSVDEFLGDNPRRLYRFTPNRTWRNVDGETNGKFVDTRKEVTLMKALA